MELQVRFYQQMDQEIYLGLQYLEEVQEILPLLAIVQLAIVLLRQERVEPLFGSMIKTEEEN